MRLAYRCGLRVLPSAKGRASFIAIRVAYRPRHAQLALSQSSGYTGLDLTLNGLESNANFSIFTGQGDTSIAGQASSGLSAACSSLTRTSTATGKTPQSNINRGATDSARWSGSGRRPPAVSLGSAPLSDSHIRSARLSISTSSYGHSARQRRAPVGNQVTLGLEIIVGVSGCRGRSRRGRCDLGELAAVAAFGAGNAAAGAL